MDSCSLCFWMEIGAYFFGFIRNLWLDLTFFFLNVYVFFLGGF